MKQILHKFDPKNDPTQIWHTNDKKMTQQLHQNDETITQKWQKNTDMKTTQKLREKDAKQTRSDATKRQTNYTTWPNTNFTQTQI